MVVFASLEVGVPFITERLVDIGVPEKRITAAGFSLFDAV